MSKHLEVAQKSVLLAGMSLAESSDILQRSQVQNFDRGAPVFTQGDPATAVYIVSEGWVKLSRLSPNGTEVVVGVFNAGECIAVPVVLRRGKYPVSCSAATATTVVRVEADALMDCLRKEPETALALVASAFSHLHQLVEQVEQLKVRNALQRVADFLSELAPVENGTCEVTLPYDKALIAGRLGLAPESLSRVFGKLRPHGVVIRRDKVSIADIEALRAVAESES